MLQQTGNYIVAADCIGQDTMGLRDTIGCIQSPPADHRSTDAMPGQEPPQETEMTGSNSIQGSPPKPLLPNPVSADVKGKDISGSQDKDKPKIVEPIPDKKAPEDPSEVKEGDFTRHIYNKYTSMPLFSQWYYQNYGTLRVSSLTKQQRADVEREFCKNYAERYYLEMQFRLEQYHENATIDPKDFIEHFVVKMRDSSLILGWSEKKLEQKLLGVLQDTQTQWTENWQTELEKYKEARKNGTEKPPVVEDPDHTPPPELPPLPDILKSNDPKHTNGSPTGDEGESEIYSDKYIETITGQGDHKTETGPNVYLEGEEFLTDEFWEEDQKAVELTDTSEIDLGEDEDDDE